MERKQLAVKIIDVFEEFLSEKGISVENGEKSGEESEAIIFGSDYYRLEDRLLELIKEYEADRPVPYERLSELATRFKDGLIEDDEEEALQYFSDECEMTEQEYDYFGIEVPESEQ